MKIKAHIPSSEEDMEQQFSFIAGLSGIATLEVSLTVSYKV